MDYRSKKYRRIYNSLTNLELQDDSSSNKLISTADIMGELIDKTRPHLFLDFYSEEGIKKALEKYGILKDLKNKGFHDFIIILDTNDPYQHKLRVYNANKNIDDLLCEVYLRKKSFIAKPVFESVMAEKKLTLILIEWLLLQNPTAEFTSHRPQLPGQKHPGLKIGRQILNIFYNMALRLNTDGLLNIPEHYHNAYFYSSVFKYFNPETEGHFRAIIRDLKHIGLNKSAWAIERNCLIEKNSGKNWKWFADEQIFPVSKNLLEYFNSDKYKIKEKEAYNAVSFCLDEKKNNEDTL